MKITFFAEKLEEPGGQRALQLARCAGSLRTTAEVNKAQQQILVAGGLMPEETSEMKEKSKPQKPATPPKADMTPEMKNGAKVIDSYAKKNKELEDRLSTAEMKLTAEKTSEAQKELQKQEGVRPRRSHRRGIARTVAVSLQELSRAALAAQR